MAVRRYQIVRGTRGRKATALPPRWLGGAGAAAGVAQLVEHQPSKLRVAGSSPVARFADGDEPAPVAQLVERILGKDEVTGSTPVGSSGRLAGGLVAGGRWQEPVLLPAASRPEGSRQHGGSHQVYRSSNHGEGQV